MKKTYLLILLLASLSLSAWGLSIYEIQYSTFPGSDNTYPSPYAGKSVSTEGIVTATNYKGGGFFISETVAGAFNGILVSDRNASIRVGDRVRLKATVKESFGMTILEDVSSLSILERNHPLPHPVILTTAQLGRAMEAEAYEGVYAKILSVSSGKSKSSRQTIRVSDGTGLCSVQLGSFGDNLSVRNIGSHFTAITGIVSFGFGEFSLNPVSASDIEVNQPVSIQSRSWGKIKSIYK
ncbi:MAG: hypothetical protein PHU99_05690 [Candidatus Cloacimonetes bacterium]|jgi:hypothetical protein|nr:hypothetical protein [Candidatus Cloacimonadota bacterium]MDY0336548.1 hypothetical protein [Candidatus Cloacimonadaceae bacterium]MCK9334951.1 hypothetical protein [Candidatus Cloacimonadota bacterium]MDD2542917.1 hypothetical protein [Candidatus Cloacimonadota bacterium]MDD2683488.1 hypothetical protein [Candidatus Cloacimonadota bacterium]